MAGKIYRFGKRLEQGLDDMVGLIPVEQLHMQIAPGFVGETLKELASQAKAECGGHILSFFSLTDRFVGQITQSPPNQERPAAEIDHAPCQAFIHRHVGLAGEGVPRVEARAVATDALFVAQRLEEGLAEGDAAILDRVVRVHRQITAASERQIHDRVPGEEHQHVVEECNSRADRRMALAVHVQFQTDRGFSRFSVDPGLSLNHRGPKLSRARGCGKVPSSRGVHVASPKGSAIRAGAKPSLPAIEARAAARFYNFPLAPGQARVYRYKKLFMKAVAFLLTTAVGLLAHSAFGESPRGSLLELHSCELYAGGCIVSSESPQGGRYLVRAWNFSGGSYAGTDFAGLRLAALQVSADNLAAAGAAPGQAIVYLPDTATTAQREALLAWFKSQQPGLESLQTRVVPLRFASDAQGYNFSAGYFINVQTSSFNTCDASACGEALWYTPKTTTTVFTVALDRSSQVTEPWLQLKWTDAGKRSVFLAKFGDQNPVKDVFLISGDLCGAAEKLF